ncbi:recombinase family protein [Sphingomonas sp.]|uniref:recombinase family protein n=1 Tax=Sphingomonas sp. TaxID=28214 RepID=UPI000DB527C1|nr:recombinase family protein [Sphingomonas sp.]PZU08508.1 MAG: hypothetical protein DI605_11060 [Sphingomonas sp.]
MAKPASAITRSDKVRCAIYTRKSTEEGLEQEFNSLDAQREACAAYITSQRHEGWTPVPHTYDDGGYSGGSLERPGLKQLLADIAAGKVDVIVVYKVDRLTRSLADFSKIVEVLERANASFVSVTQAFNTTTSMGRLMLNVLLSFAQFEREVTGERIRDKVAASKRKGMWMGGPVPLGYDLGSRKLVINEAEAADVRAIYKLYLELGSIGALAAELEQRGIRTKPRTYKDGRAVGGIAFYPGPLSYLIKNPLYIGEVQHRGERFPGEHEGIVERDVWEAAQRLLADNRNSRRVGGRAASPSLLAGIIKDAEGRAMTPSHSTRGSRRYRYYFTQVGVDRKMPADGWRIPASDVEQAVRDKLRRLLSRSSELLDVLGPLDRPAPILEAAALLAGSMVAMATSELRASLLAIRTEVTISEAAIQISVARDKLLLELGAVPAEEDAPPIVLTIPAKLTRCGLEMRMVIDAWDPAAPALVDAALVKLIVRAEQAHRTLVEGGSTIPRLERNELARHARLHTLAPDIVSAIVEGRQPRSLSARRLLRVPEMPMDWREQRKTLGFS